MKTLRTSLMFACGAMLLAACGDDSGSVALQKGVVDEDALSTGVTVTLSGHLGSVSVPFMEPVPEVSDEDLQEELAASVSLQVASAASGVSVDLAAGGTIVDSTPSGPGQWTWELNDDRDEATMRFFNHTVNDLMLHAGHSYTATLSIATNQYIERVTVFTMPITVTGSGSH